MKKSIALLISVAFIATVGTNALAESDATNDVWHQSWTATGYEWEAYSGTKSNIDITDLSYSIDGTTATITMTTVGDMTDTENVVYTMHLQSSDEAYYMIMYTNGQGSVIGMGEYMGFSSQLDNPISGNTFTASFEINNPDADYKVIGFNVEHSDIDADQGESWWDYAPNSEAPYYSAGDDDDDTSGDDDDDTSGDDDDDTSGDDTNGDGTPPEPSTPGFELLAIISAIGIALIILKRRK